MSQNEFKKEPDWLNDAEGKFHKINVNTNSDSGGMKDKDNNIVTKWIYIIEDDTFEDGVIAMDVTDRVERDMKGGQHKYHG